MRQSLQNQTNHSVMTADAPMNYLIFWTLAGFVLLFLFIAPFRTALFNGIFIQYERDIYAAVAWSAIFLLILAVYMLFRRDHPAVSGWLSLLAWGIPLAYVMSFISAVSPHQNSIAVQLNVMYAALFTISAYLARSLRGAYIIQFGITASGYWVVLYTYLNLFGNAYYTAAVTTDQGLRLTSVFQYANAYAGFLIALLLCCLYYIVASRRWYVAAVHAVMLVPLLVAFLLTLSRGGLVLLPVILLVILPLIPLVRQLAFFLYLFIGLGAAFLITDRVRSIGVEMLKRTQPAGQDPQTFSLFDPLSLQGWLTLLIAAAVTAAVIVAIQMLLVPRIESRLDKLSGWQWSRLLLPGLLCIGGILGIFALSQLSLFGKFLPQALLQRIENINFQQHSVLERLMMFRDALKIYGQYPVFGAGGGAWNNLHLSVQGAPYIPRQAHSFYLQYLDETGTFGLLVLLALLGCVFYFYIRRIGLNPAANNGHSLPYYLIAAAILIHSAMDFEMSYGYIASLVFICLGGMAAAIPDQSRQEESWLNRLWDAPIRKIAYPAVLGIVALATLIVSMVDLRANAYFYAAVEADEKGRPAEEIIAHLDNALKLNPNHPTIIKQKIAFLNRIYLQTKNEQTYREAGELIEKLKNREPYNVDMFEAEFGHYYMAGDLEKALEVAYRRLESNRWGISTIQDVPNWYERVIGLNSELGLAAREANDTEAMNRYWDAAIRDYHIVLDKLEELERLPEEQLHEPFGVTPAMAISIGQIEFVRGNYQEAADALKAGLNKNWQEEVNRFVTRWYLAALQKMGKEDQKLYDEFVGQFPEEKQEIAALANLRS